MGRVLTVFSGLAIVIAVFGLTGLAAYVTARRTKEISIRRVLGATIPSIFYLVSKEFLILVGAAVAIACPLAYYLVSNWLAGFAYRSTIEWTAFAVTGIGALVLSFLVVCVQATRAAITNPVDVIKE